SRWRAGPFPPRARGGGRRARAHVQRCRAPGRTSGRARPVGRRSRLIPGARRRYVGRMTAHAFRVIDSDMHVLEPPDLWQRYIDPAWRHAAPVGLTELRRDMRVKVKSHVMLRLGPLRPITAGATAAWSSEQDRVFADAEARGWDAGSQVAAMDAEGLDLAVL